MLRCLLCDRARRTRGLCYRCYNRALARVRAGATTWDAEVAAGRARPPDRDARQRWRYP